MLTYGEGQVGSVIFKYAIDRKTEKQKGCELCEACAVKVIAVIAEIENFDVLEMR